MISLTTNVQQPNIVRWRVVSFELQSGYATVRFESQAAAQWIDLRCLIADAAGASNGVAINPTTQRWDDRIINTTGVGVANALTNARNAYRGAANHNAGLRAVEGQALTDGWIEAALTGT